VKIGFFSIAVKAEKWRVFGAKFNASPILIANKDNPYTITVNFTFEPSIRFN